MSAPKIEHPLSIVVKADASANDIARNRQLPIGSISKSFCGLTSALMAVDGKFGEKGLEASVGEVLEIALAKTEIGSEKYLQINKYLTILAEKGLTDTKLSNLLNHTAGLLEGIEDSPYDPLKDGEFYRARSTLEIAQEKFQVVPENKGQHKYSNANFILMEEIINFTSEKNYEAELQDRIFTPLGMTRTGSLYKSDEALETGVGSYVVFDESGVLQEYNLAFFTPGAHGRASLSAGGLCSTYDDLEKYSRELTKVITGQGNLLSDRPEVLRAMYEEAVTDRYSLGVKLEKDARTGATTIRHKGAFPANENELRVTVSESGEIDTKNILTKKDGLALAIIDQAERNGKVAQGEALLRNYQSADGIVDSEKLRSDFKTISDIDRGLSARMSFGKFTAAALAQEEKAKGIEGRI